MVRAGAETIFLGTAVEVGGSENPAPTLTPTALPTATATQPWWEGPTPSSPQVMMPPIGPVPDIDLAGIDAVLRVDAVYAGDPGTEFTTGQVARSAIERELREWEARAGGPVSSCELDAFVPRYEAGRQYLLFVEGIEGTTEFDSYVSAVFRVDDADLLSGLDPLLSQAGQGWLSMNSTTYSQYFAGLPAETSSDYDYVSFDETRVPLSRMLDAVAGLRGETSIVPPDAGSAGLKSADR